MMVNFNTLLLLMNSPHNSPENKAQNMRELTKPMSVETRQPTAFTQKHNGYMSIYTPTYTSVFLLFNEDIFPCEEIRKRSQSLNHLI